MTERLQHQLMLILVHSVTRPHLNVNNRESVTTSLAVRHNCLSDVTSAEKKIKRHENKQ
jgi:hypothetical protein